MATLRISQPAIFDETEAYNYIYITYIFSYLFIYLFIHLFIYLCVYLLRSHRISKMPIIPWEISELNRGL